MNNVDDDMTIAVGIWIEVTWRRDNEQNLLAPTWQVLKLGKLLRRSWWNLLSSNIGYVVQ